MQSFLNLERRNFNAMLRQSINSLLEAKKSNKAVCNNCGNTSDFRVNVEKNELSCKNGVQAQIDWDIIFSCSKDVLNKKGG